VNQSRPALQPGEVELSDGQRIAWPVDGPSALSILNKIRSQRLRPEIAPEDKWKPWSFVMKTESPLLDPAITRAKRVAKALAAISNRDPLRDGALTLQAQIGGDRLDGVDLFLIIAAWEWLRARARSRKGGRKSKLPAETGALIDKLAHEGLSPAEIRRELHLRGLDASLTTIRKRMRKAS
jgi:hypothetical protein